MLERLAIGEIYELDDKNVHVLITDMPESTYGRGKYFLVREEKGQVNCYKLKNFDIRYLKRKLIVRDAEKVELSQEQANIASRVLSRRGL